MSPDVLFDVLLSTLIVAVALSAVVVRDLFAAIVFFIVYGVFVAIAWVRLDAPDVALAEAAIGAGLTGILLVGAAGRMGTAWGGWALTGSPAWRLAGGLRVLACVALAAGLVVVVLSAPRLQGGLTPLVEQNLAASGVDNPVTAVLLNFRGYDTLLETLVLLVALVGVWSLTDDRFWGGAPGLKQHARPAGVLAFFGRVLPVLGLLVGVHLLWAGAYAPGGAFQAGTVLAAVWLLMAKAGLADVPSVSAGRLRLLLIAGPAVFLLFAVVSAAAGAVLTYPPELAKNIILVIEIFVALSIAVTLSLLVLGVPRRPA